MNTQTAPWNDVHVRRAVAYTLNRSDIIAANGGYATPLYTLIPPQMLGTVASQSQVSSFLASIPLYQYSLSKAKAEMAQSAYPNGFSANLLAYNSGSSVNISQVISAELQQIGIHLQVQTATLNAWRAVETGPASKRQPTFSTGACLSPDVSWYTFVLGSKNTQTGEWNLADYAPSGVDNLINAGIATTQPSVRFATYSKLLQRLATDVPYVPLYVGDANIALSSKFTWPGYNYWSSYAADYALQIKAAA